MAIGAPFHRTGSNRIGTALFRAGAALFAAVLIAVVALPLLIRDGVPVPVDSYYYIAKAAQLIQCPLQDCPALTDLRQQLIEPIPGDAEAERERAVVLQRLFYMYHAGHSALLAGLHLAGLGWETALDTLSIAGALLIAGGAIFFLRRLVGPGPAGIGLALLAFQVHPGFHGLHWIVPSNFALGVALPLWGWILYRRQAAGRQPPAGALDLVLPLAVLALVWIHPIGRAYGALAVALHAGVGDWRRTRWWVVNALATLAWATPMIAPYLFSQPMFSAAEFLHPPGWSWSQGVQENLAAAGPLLANRLGGWPGLVMLAGAGVGLFAALQEGRGPMLLAGGLVALLLGGSLLHGLPGYPAELFQRVSVPATIVLAGLFGFGLWRIATATIDDGAFSRVGPAGAAAVGLALFAAQAVDGGPALFKKVAVTSYGGLTRVDPDLPARALRDLPSDAALVYLDQLSLYLFLTHGGLEHGAVYARALTDRRMGATQLERRRDLMLAAGRLTLVTGGIPLDRGAEGRFALPRPTAKRAIRLGFVNRAARPVEIGIEGAAPITLAPGARVDHQPWPDAPTGARVASLALTHRGGPAGARLVGLALSPDQASRWPWRAGAALVHEGPPPEDDFDWPTPASGKDRTLTAEGRLQRTAAIDWRALLPAGCAPRDVLADDSSVVVFEVACGPGAPRMAMD